MHLAFTKPLKQARTRPLAVYSVVFSLSVLALVMFSANAGAQGAGYWHTSGAKILDSNGATVRIAGINWYGFEGTNYIPGGIADQDYRSILDTIQSLGYNVIRLPFSNEMVESNPVPTPYTTWAVTTAAPNGGPANQPLYGNTALEDMDAIISYAGQIGLRVILDNHRSEAGNSNEASGLWYTSTYTQADWIADWQTLVTRYSSSAFTFNGNPTVIAVDLRNEPHLSPSTGVYTGSCWTGDTFTSGTYTGCPVTNTAQNWPVAAQLAGNAVLAINPKLLVVVEGIDCYDDSCDWQGGNLMGVATNPIVLSVANQLVYSAHDYGPDLYDQPWFTSTTTAASLAAVWNQNWEYISAAGTAPVWLGELGTDNTATDIENTVAGSQGQWFEDLIAYLAANPNLSWTYWALNGEDPYDLLASNYGPTPVAPTKQSELASIQAPLAAAPASFWLNESADTLSLGQGGSYYITVGVTEVNGSDNVTLSVSGLPSGVTGTFATNPTTSTSVLTFAASSTAMPGVYNLTITGTSGTLTSSVTFALTITGTAPAQSFTLASSPSTLSVTQGSNATDTITVTDVGGFTGSVTLAASGLPSGVTAAFGTNPTATTSVLTLTASSSATTGAATVTITGTSGSLNATTTIALSVVASTGSFTLKPSASTLSVTQGSNGTDTITVTDVSPFSGSVTLAASGLPSGVTAGFGTNPATSTSVLTLTASSSATAGASTVTITGTSGSLNATTTIALTVVAATGSFTLTPSASSLSVTQGSNGTDTITVTDVSPFDGSVTLAASGLPSGVTAAFGTNPTTSTSVLTLTASSSATTGSATVTITGTSGSLNATTTIALTVVAATGSFTLKPSASSLTVEQGKSGTDTITVTDVSPFDGSVTLAASGLPSGVTAAFGTNPATSTSVLTLTASSSATTGSATVTVKGTSGSLTATTTIALTVSKK